ncbi:hypothetical protein F511_11099 [Dorcoceras hygrometricum]|uniref:Retrotransposon gag domain-containing protein n=1 Tax=Dorcoceras hygrometricum TaxID=472368 RepID=A0A2Z7BKK3_9LAMI|nr:hypothetical protein F511_11099 [Dorcoceras hygrometricum]
MEELFDALEYSQERRLKLAVLQLREHAQRWWKGTSRVMRETGVVISWESFCAAFRQEYTPESFYNNREREFDNLKQGNLRVAEYARQFSSLLSYVPHVANQERTNRNKFLRGLRPDLFRMMLAGSPVTYAEAVDRAVDIEESLMEVQNQVQPIAGRSFQPVPEVMTSFQSPQVLQQSNSQRFEPRGKQFKNRSNSSYSGSVSSGGSGSRGGVTCGQCGGCHMTSQFRGVHGLCHNYGQPGHFARVCPACWARNGVGSGSPSRGAAENKIARETINTIKFKHNTNHS